MYHSSRRTYTDEPAFHRIFWPDDIHDSNTTWHVSILYEDTKITRNGSDIAAGDIVFFVISHPKLTNKFIHDLATITLNQFEHLHSFFPSNPFSPLHRTPKSSQI